MRSHQVIEAVGNGEKLVERLNYSKHFKKSSFIPVKYMEQHKQDQKKKKKHL